MLKHLEPGRPPLFADECVWEPGKHIQISSLFQAFPGFYFPLSFPVSLPCGFTGSTIQGYVVAWAHTSLCSAYAQLLVDLGYVESLLCAPLP